MNSKITESAGEFMAFPKYLYRNTLKRIPTVSNAVFSLKELLRYKTGYYSTFCEPSWCLNSDSSMGLRIAVISDQFTWENITGEFDAVYLNPSDWLKKMETFKPNLFFCEAAWEGINKVWDNQIYRNPIFMKDNRSVLKDILRYCASAKIPTVFWNKEDSPAEIKTDVDFRDTALLFDHIFTTAEECIPIYRGMGHSSVHLMMFGYSPALFSQQKLPDNRNAVFFGSWYGDMPERCKDMEAVFDMVLSEGLNLVIYDRASESDNPLLKYPTKYLPYVRPAVPYNQLGAVMADARYVININSVKDSRTMFARRVFEAMACGRIVISNESLGLRELFPGRIWFIGNPFCRSQEEKIVEENIQTAKEKYTFEKQLLNALENAKLYYNS